MINYFIFEQMTAMNKLILKIINRAITRCIGILFLFSWQLFLLVLIG